MTSSINIKHFFFIKTLRIIYQSIHLLILIKLFYYEIFWNSYVEKILRLKVLTMMSSVNTWKLVSFKIMIIIYHSKNNLIMIIFCYCEFLWKPIEKRYRGFKRAKMTCVLRYITEIILYQEKNHNSYAINYWRNQKIKLKIIVYFLFFNNHFS